MSNSGVITTRDNLRARRQAQDEYRKAIGKKTPTLRTRAGEFASNVHTKVTGAPPKKVGGAGKVLMSKIDTMASDIRDDKENYENKRQGMALTKRLNPKTKISEMKAHEKTKTLHNFKNTSHTTVKDSIEHKKATLQNDLAAGRISKQQYKAQLKSFAKERKGL